MISQSTSGNPSKTLIEQALHGSLLAAAVILLFLEKSHQHVDHPVAILLSILVTFIVFVFHQSDANVHDGRPGAGDRRLVDDSIVELENINAT